MISSTNLAAHDLRSTENLQFRPTNIGAFDARYQRLTSVEGDLLKNCAALEDFLPKAIDFLKKNNGKNLNEDVAHYLMGQKNYLPNGLGAPTKEIPHNAKALLHDLLRTHRYGIVGKEESREHTITKLESLNTRLFGYDVKLEKWVNDAKSGEKADRQSAAAEIKKSMESGGKSLCLKGLKLTSIPPLPASLVTLELSGNIKSLENFPQLPNLKELKITNNEVLASLEGMPKTLSNLEKLTIQGCNALPSLKGLPQELNKLGALSIDKNNKLESLAGMPNMPQATGLSITENKSLKSVKGMPAELPKLETLLLENNGLSSLEGMTQELPNLKHLNAQKNQLSSLEGLPPTLPKIISLLFPKNQLTSLQGMPAPAQLPQLRRIDISDNQLSSIPPVNSFSKLEALAYSGNPVAIKENIFEKMNRLVPGQDFSFMKDYGLKELEEMKHFLQCLSDCEQFSGLDRHKHEKELHRVVGGMGVDSDFRKYCASRISDFSKYKLDDASSKAPAVFDEMCRKLTSLEKKMSP